ncbi:hypothetical protein [Bacillus coahuilensis]|uniref:hypothetical protein n=1 Tax=Bacillus coahuilensis TaxID=408580 RepID=UPI0001850719|nr:hypothetical protein [Bacillus coahuilensis]
MKQIETKHQSSILSIIASVIFLGMVLFTVQQPAPSMLSQGDQTVTIKTDTNKKTRRFIKHWFLWR